MRWRPPRHRKTVQVLLGSWRLSGSASGVIWWYTINLTTCMSEWHVDPLVKSAFCCLPYRILQILISNIKVHESTNCVRLIFADEHRQKRTEPSRRLDRWRKRHPPGGLRVVVCCGTDRILFSPLGLDMKFAWERYFSYLLNLPPCS